MTTIKERFVLNMKLNGMFPPGRIESDEKIHTYKSDNGVECWYLLSPNKPAIGLYGQCNENTHKRWAMKRKSNSSEAVYQEKLSRLRKLVKKYRSELNGNREPVKIIDRRTTKLKQLSFPFEI